MTTIDTTGYEKIGQASWSKRSPRDCFSQYDCGCWYFIEGSPTPATPGTATALEQMEGARTVIYIDRNTGEVYRRA